MHIFFDDKIIKLTSVVEKEVGFKNYLLRSFDLESILYELICNHVWFTVWSKLIFDFHFATLHNDVKHVIREQNVPCFSETPKPRLETSYEPNTLQYSKESKVNLKVSKKKNILLFNFFPI